MSVRITTKKDALFAALKRTVPGIEAELKKALIDTGEEITAAQKRFVPVRSGKLRDSITWYWNDRRNQRIKYSQTFGTAIRPAASGLGIVVSVGNTKVRYAHLVEFGTKPHKQGGRFKGTMHPGTTPRPFFFPGYRLVKRRIKPRLTRAMTRAIKKAGFGSK